MVKPHVYMCRYARWLQRRSCVLCSQDVTSGTMKIKRIKTSGEAAKATVDLLNSLARRSYSKNFFGSSNNQTFICYKCRNKAEALYQKVQTSEQELIKAVSAVLDSRQSDTQRPNKRNLSKNNPMNVDNVDKRRQQ